MWIAHFVGRCPYGRISAIWVGTPLIVPSAGSTTAPGRTGSWVNGRSMGARRQRMNRIRRMATPMASFGRVVCSTGSATQLPTRPRSPRSNHDRRVDGHRCRHRLSQWWLTVLYAATASVTFVMVFVIQHTKARQTSATQRKLDELIRPLTTRTPH